SGSHHPRLPGPAEAGHHVRRPAQAGHYGLTKVLPIFRNGTAPAEDGCMTTSVRVAAVALWIGLSAYGLGAQQPAALTVVQSGPTNEIQNLREANEIRIVFSEPMVVLGRIPDPVTAPFVTIRPAIQGTFRWSGTTILIFTPDPSAKLPNATQY